MTTQAQPTRTSETGGIVSFAQQLEVRLDGVNWYDHVLVSFDATSWASPSAGRARRLEPWDNPITVYVRSHENNRVDGGDTRSSLRRWLS